MRAGGGLTNYSSLLWGSPKTLSNHRSIVTNEQPFLCFQNGANRLKLSTQSDLLVNDFVQSITPVLTSCHCSLTIQLFHYLTIKAHWCKVALSTDVRHIGGSRSGFPSRAVAQYRFVSLRQEQFVNTIAVIGGRAASFAAIVFCADHRCTTRVEQLRRIRLVVRS